MNSLNRDEKTELCETVKLPAVSHEPLYQNTKVARYEYTLRDFLYTLFKYKWLILIFTFSSVFAATMYSYIVSQKYSASAKVLIEFEENRVLSSIGNDKGGSGAMVTTMSHAEIIRSEIEIIQGKFIADKLYEEMGDQLLGGETPKQLTFFGRIKKFLKIMYKGIKGAIENVLVKVGLSESLTKKEMLTLLLQKGILAEQIKNSNVISVTYKSSSPELAAHIVNRVIDIYQSHRIAMFTTSAAAAFLDSTTRKYREELEESETLLTNFQKTYQITSIDEQISHLLKLDAEIRGEIAKSQAELSELNGKHDAIRHFTVSNNQTDDSIITKSNNVIDGLKLRMLDLRLKRINLAMQFNDKDQGIQTIDNEIEYTKTQLLRETAGAAIFADMAGIEARIEMLNGIREKCLNEIRSVSSRQSQLNSLKRNKDKLEKLYEIYFEKSEEARITDAKERARISAVRVIESATPPILPVRLISFVPQRIMNISVALFFGLFVSLSLVALFEMTDRSFRFGEEVEYRLGIPLLGSISEKKYSNKNKSGMKFKPLEPEKNSIPQQDDEYRNIINNFRLYEYERPLQCIQFTGSLHGEGVSSISSRFAELLSIESNGRTLYVKADFRYQNLHDEASPGLCDVITGKCPLNTAIQKSPFEKLDILSVGRVQCDPYRVFTLQGFNNLLHDLRASFSYIIIDSPELSFPESIYLANLVDKTILVIQAENTRYDIVKRNLNTIFKTGRNIPFCVLNRRRHYIPKSIYAYL